MEEQKPKYYPRHHEKSCLTKGENSKWCVQVVFLKKNNNVYKKAYTFYLSKYFFNVAIMPPKKHDLVIVDCKSVAYVIDCFQLKDTEEEPTKLCNYFVTNHIDKDKKISENLIKQIKTRKNVQHLLEDRERELLNFIRFRVYKFKKCTNTLKEISQILGYSIPTINKSLKILEEKELISIEKTTTGNVYTLNKAK